MSNQSPKLFRFSLREFLGVVVFLSVALGGLMFANQAIAGILSLVAAVFGLYFLARAVFDRGTTRVFAIGFLLGAFGYWATDELVSPALGWLNVSYHSWGTNDLLESLYQVMAFDASFRPLNSPFGTAADPQLPMSRTWNSDRYAFFVVGKSLFFLLFGYVGGRLARFAYEHRLASKDSINIDEST